MISNGLKRWQQSRSFRIGDDVVYGVYQSVGFSVSEEDGGKLFIFMLSGPDAAFDDMEDLLKSQRGDLRLVEVGDVETYLALFFDENGGDMHDSTMDDLLDFVADNCRACGFKAPNVCVKCGAPANKRSLVDNMVQPVCAECRAAEKAGPAPRRREQAREDAYAATTAPAPVPAPPQRPSRYDEGYGDYDERDARRPRRDYDDQPYEDRYDDRYDDYPERPAGGGSGILGAIIGALAGLVPYFISVFISLELAFLGFISGIGAVLGYIAFRGEKDKSKAMTMSMVTSGLLVILSVLGVNMLENIKGSFGETLSYTFSHLPWMNLVLAILGVLLGVAVVIDRILAYIESED